MGRLDGKVALITGGEGSLGMATARLFTAEGAQVMLAGIDEERLRAGGAELGCAWTVADVSDSGQVQAAVRAVIERFARLDVVVSNAGVFGVVAPVVDYPDDVFDRVLAVHVRGTFLVCKHALPVMSDGGSVIITSSVVGLTSDAGVGAYATAKHALVGLMRTVAKEVAPRGIRVNTIHPGPVDNDFQRAVETAATGAPAEEAAALFNAHIPLARHAIPEEVGRVILFLAGDDSSFVTGSPIPVDGGMSI
ncbi:SDR family NAD(P)-dependent oxidoreductase [Nonomuraea sp. NEAU-A123]|uniref:SDR family NAD(P)-dependent oxidoreductase n=1 Tax=Nonomuraea sp. NEAU-A123 TaxID=2839649 RepID=UPI001BE42469|nr:SDR family NAD(P)-dependent oxidoreductase [Nonomuraea sp. NEAU-A123]MBT2232921.1 SDR family oxidoreductase [Nonomuraea sp. NEAU-A123]